MTALCIALESAGVVEMGEAEMRHRAGTIFLVLLMFVSFASVVLASDTVSLSTEDIRGTVEDSPVRALRNAEWARSGEPGPPPWAPELARERAAWGQKGEEGPPPWVSEWVVERAEWSGSDGEGPPPWAPVPDVARQRAEWGRSGQKDPPPWAGGNGANGR